MTRNELLGRPIAFGKFIMPEMFTRPSPELHYDMAFVFINRERYTKSCFIAPRGHAKSSIVAGVFPLYHLLMEFPGHPKFILLTAKTRDHSVRLLQTIKDTLEYSQNLRAMFGYWGRFSAKIWRDDYVVLKDGTIIMAKGTGQQVIGLKYIHQRPTLIILDDPEDLENTATAERMERNLEWLLRQLIPTRDPDRARIMVIGTPQRQNCMVENIARMSDFETRRYSALMDDDTRALWPDGPLPLKLLLAEKKAAIDIGRLSYFKREYECVVTSDEQNALTMPRDYSGSILHEHGEAYLVIDPPNKQKIPVNVFMGIDPATSTSTHSDFTAILPGAIDRERNFYVLPYVRRRMRPSETINEIIRMNRLLRPKGVALEATAAQETFRDILRNYEGERIPGLSRKIIPRERKEKRYLDVLEPLLFRGKIYVLRNMTDLKNEILSYGPLRSHDDLLDALYYAIHYAYPPSHEVVIGSPGDNRSLQDYGTWATA